MAPTSTQTKERKAENMFTQKKILPDTKVALVGSRGMLGSMVRRMAPAEVEIIEYDLPDIDITDKNSVAASLHRSRPHFIINCAAFTDVDGCETSQKQAMAVNATGPSNLAEVASDIDATLLHISTDFVFSGSKKAPYIESDPPEPLCVYGESKYLGEKGVESSPLRNYFIVRTSWLYGPRGKNFVETIICLARECEELNIVSDQVGTPTYSGDLAVAIWNLLGTPKYGTYHYSNEGQCSWYDFACEIVGRMRRIEGNDCFRVKRVNPVESADFPQAATRPSWSVMSKEKIKQNIGLNVPQWQESLQHYLQERQRYSDF
jgi:dTDP-4-dehydrorhamnose reductase